MTAAATGPEYFEHLAAELAQRLPGVPPGHVLELACGTGMVTRHLRERLHPSFQLVAIESDAAMLDDAREKLQEYPGIKWHRIDTLDVPFNDGAFGAVVCGFGMNDIADRHAALNEVRRVLVDGGLFVFSLWECDRNELRDMLGAAGFDVTRAQSKRKAVIVEAVALRREN